MPLIKLLYHPVRITSEANILMDFIQNYKTRKSILGICLGHQALGVFWASLAKY